MTLLEGLDPSSSHHLPEACDRIEDARSLCAAPLASLIQLPWSADDTLWLKRWLREVPAEAIHQRMRWRGAQLAGRPGIVELGTLLWAAWSHVALAESRGGILWPHLRHATGKVLRQALFTSQGQITSQTGLMLRASAHHLRLRHVFDREGVQEYYTSILLQVGFPTPAAQEHLPEWLVGLARPRSVDLLLMDPELRSDEFIDVWRALRQMRRGESARLARAATAQSPWMRLRPIDTLLAAAVTRVGQLGVPEPQEDEDIEETPPFEARLIWRRGGRPFVELHARGPLPVDDRSETHLLRSRGEHLAILPPHQDQPDPVRVDSLRPEVPLELLSLDADLLWSGAVPVWDPEEDFTVWDAESGEPLTAGRTIPSRCILRLSPGLELSDAAGIEDNRGEFFLAHWPSDTEPAIRDPEGRTHPIRPARRVVKPRPLQIECGRKAGLGEPLELYASGIPDDACVEEWRIAGRAAAGQPVGRDYRLTLDQAPPLSQRVIVRAAGHDRSSRVWFRGEAEDVFQVGAAFEEDDGTWIAASQANDLERRVRAGHRLAARSGDRETSIWIVEGSRVVERRGPNARPKPLSNLSAYGAPVRLVRRLRNRLGEDVLANLGRLHAPVTIWGRLQLGTESIAILEPFRELDPTHRIVIWLKSEPEPRVIAPHFDADSHTWIVRLESAEMDDLLAAGLSSNGSLLTSWVRRRVFDESVAELGLEPVVSLALLRWFRAAVLERTAHRFVAATIEHHSTSVLQAWVADQGLPEGLNHHGERHHIWNEAVTQLLLRHAVPKETLTDDVVLPIPLDALWMLQPALAVRAQAARCSNVNRLCLQPNAVEVAKLGSALQRAADEHRVDPAYLKNQICLLFRQAVGDEPPSQADDLPALLDTASFTQVIQELADHYLPVRS